VNKAKKQIRGLAEVQVKKDIFDLQDTVRGTPTSGVPESVPVRAYECFDFGQADSQIEPIRKFHENNQSIA
jgi:hypothetical protein